MDAEPIEATKERYANEWLAIEITAEERGEPTEGRLLAHSPDREALHQALMRLSPREAYIVFAGPLVPEGHAFILSPWPTDR